MGGLKHIAGRKESSPELPYGLIYGFGISMMAIIVGRAAIMRKLQTRFSA
jgi:hypothetical protein